MTTKTLLPPYVEEYVTQVFTKELAVQSRLREETSRMPLARMLTSPDQVAFLQMLIRLTGARLVLEVGTFTGCSALGMALALPSDGTLVACDVSDEWTRVARKYWKEAGVDAKVDLQLRPAKETLLELLELVERGERNPFDLAFVDADKGGYDNYYELGLRLVRQGGLLVFDNVLWSGKVAREAPDDDEDTRALRALNLKARDDKRVDANLLTIADGLLLVRKR